MPRVALQALQNGKRAQVAKLNAFCGVLHARTIGQKRQVLENAATEVSVEEIGSELLSRKLKMFTIASRISQSHIPDEFGTPMNDLYFKGDVSAVRAACL